MMTSQSATVLTQQQTSFFPFPLQLFPSGGEGLRGGRKTVREGAASVGWSQITDLRG